MMQDDIVYFELNNWFPVEDYPNAEPFITWCGNDLNLYFSNENWVKENKLCVVESFIDMAVNWCITAPKSWVMKNCPLLLSDSETSEQFVISQNGKEKTSVNSKPYSYYLRHPDENGDVIGRFGTDFLPYMDENIGISFGEDL